MDGFNVLGAEASPRPPLSLESGAVAVGAGAVAAWLFRRSHPVLAFMDTAALAVNVRAVARKERTWQEAAKRVGRHVVATVGSLALPAYPLIGYVAGAVAADLLIDGEGGGILEEWVDYLDVRKNGKVVDAVEAKPQTALVKVS